MQHQVFDQLRMGIPQLPISESSYQKEHELLE